ncbi:pericentriolar material 1 protein-like isoform X4 [Halichondria panicea]
MSEDSYSGRVHISSSVPRTRFTAKTSRSEREGIENLRTKMTFSDHSTESSARSTPRKKQSNLPLEGIVSPRGHTSLPSYVLDAGRDDGASEGELTNSVTVQDILVKLDSVKNYLKEAESLQKQLQDKVSEPGASAQVEKLNKLIRELRQQETSYLAVLLRIIDRGETFSQLNTTQEESGSEISEDEDSLEGDEALSLSLRAELQQQKSEELTTEQEEELRVLRQQQQMLRDLIQQQEKIKELEGKQAELLRRRNMAQKELVDAEAKTQEYRHLTEASAMMSEGKPLANEQPDKPPEDDQQENEEETRSREALLKKIATLKERKEKLEGLMDSFAQVQLEDPEATPEGSSEESDSGDGEGDTSVEQAEEASGTSEFVNPSEGLADAELEAKLRKAADARQKLKELRLTIDSLKEATGMTPDDRGESAVRRSDGGASVDEGDTTLDATLEEREGDLDRSLVVDYQQRLVQKRQEVAQLQKQKDDLLQMQERILTMQEEYLDPDDCAPSQQSAEGEGLPLLLAQELEKQQQLYDEIMAKTEKLKNLRVQYQEEVAKTSEHDTYSLTSSTRLLTEADLTTATWGGSTVQSDESSDNDSDSSGGDPPQQTIGASVSVQTGDVVPDEQLPFSVTRHTPRRNPARRTLSDTGDTPKSADKRRKLETEEHSRGATSKGAGSKYNGPSAVWPGVIFPTQRRPAPTRDSSSQTPNHAPTNHGAANFPPPEPTAGATMMPPGDNMNPQFGFMSNMCSELLRGQNQLIGALCHKMDLDSSINILSNYHRELDGYYRHMCQAHARLEQAAPQSEAEEPIDAQPPPETSSLPPDEPRPSQYGYQQQQPGVTDHLSSGGSSLLRPPPPMPMVMSQSPYPPRPVYQPGWYHNPSPMAFSFSPHFSSQFGTNGMSPFQGWPHFGSTGYSPQVVPPHNVQQNPSTFHPGATNDGTHAEFPEINFRDLLLNSPSGITSASVQVQAPSTPPPSAPPSVKSLNSNNNNTTQLRVPTTTVGSSNYAEGMPTNSEREGGNKDQDEESISSMPFSAPDDTEVAQSSSEVLVEGGAGFSVFDALRDTIYSEVATLIANNENRPHYLVELFRELQLVNSDYLRQRALYNIQDLVTRFLTGEDEATPTHGPQIADSLEPTSSESEGTTEEEPPQPQPSELTSQVYDYVELAQSGSSLSTPPCPDQPFAADDLGDTVIRRDRALAKLVSGEEEGSPALQPPVVSPGPLVNEEGVLETSFEQEPPGNTFLDTKLLDEQIKDVMTEVIPILKANMAASCCPSLLDQIKNTVLDLVLKKEKERNPEFLETLTKQIDSTVTETLEKYRDKNFKDCGEDMLVDLSEVLFNELSFFNLMQDLRDHPQLSSDFRSVTSSQTTTENDDTGDETKAGPMDALLLQALTLQASRSLVDEEEALGKMRDDELAKTWDPSPQSDEEDITREEPPTASNITPEAIIDSPTEEPLSNPEAPITPPTTTPQPSVGVEGGASGEVADNIDPMPGIEHKETSSSAGDNTEATGGEDLPTPTKPTEGETNGDDVVAQVPSVEHDESGDIAPVGGIGTEGGAIQQHHASSPPSHSLVAIPQITLDVQLKSEQESIEGLPAIIASIEGQGQELAGTGEELPSNEQAEP